MRCARCFALREVRVVDSPTPEPGPREVLVAARAISICPSDHHIYREGNASGVFPDHPMIPGHEFAGVVAQLGEGVTGPAPGTRVAVEPAWHCGECDLCRRGLTNICRNVIFPSYPNRDGAMAEFIACPAHSLAVMPDELGFVEAAFAEPLGVAIHAVRHAPAGADDVVAILGAGMIGIAVLELVKLSPVGRVIVVEPNESRRPLASALGADAVHARAEDLIADVGGTAGEPSIVFDVTNSKTSLGNAVELVQPAGRIVVITIPPENESAFSPSSARRKELAIQFSRRSRGTLREALELVRAGRVRAREWPRVEFPLEEAAAAFECSVAPPPGVLRTVVRVGG